MPPLSGVGYVLFTKQQFSLAFALLYGYCGLSLFVLGHYCITPFWTLSPVINVIILSEAIAAAMLAGYALCLQFLFKDQPVA
jgi:hypothetical protein